MNRVATLRASLLVSLGLASLACGGATDSDSVEPAGGEPSGGEPSAGESFGGAPVGGEPFGGAPVGGESFGGAPVGGESFGGAPVGGESFGGGTFGGAPPTGVCTAPATDPMTGLVACAEGYTHRPTPTACSPVGTVNAPAPQAPPAPRADGETCETEEDCRGFAYGFCTERDTGFDEYSECVSGCVTDDDCEPSSACWCGDLESPTGGVCVPADCRTDADCGEGKLCTAYADVCGSGGLACQAEKDDCQRDADCRGGDYCYWDLIEGDRSFTYHRTCGNVVCGRPFLVTAEARVAPVVNDETWPTLLARRPRLHHLTAAERATLAQHWTRMGQMEHASIAAFARFSLQLLSLGAPGDLVEACARALQDETAHARLCFALASAYAGRSVGPGPLDVAGSLAAISLPEIVELVIAEGCFGETSATLEALDAAETAADPAIAAAYSQIACDERRHAELAFRFVRWALELDRHGVTERIRFALASDTRYDAAVRAVVAPCLETLLMRAAAA